MVRLQQRRHDRSPTSAPPGSRWWLQVYVPADRDRSPSRCSSAPSAAGRRAPSCSPSTPRSSARSTPRRRPTRLGRASTRRWLRVNFDPGLRRRRPAPRRRTDLGPHDVGWLAERTGLPVVVKGVLRADDARRCVEAGAAAVWVSNHGGRQLDRRRRHRRAASPAVVDAVGDARRGVRRRGSAHRPRRRWPRWPSVPTRSSSAGPRCWRSPDGERRRAPGCIDELRGRARRGAAPGRAAASRPRRHARARGGPRPPSDQASDLRKRRCGPGHARARFDTRRRVP